MLSPRNGLGLELCSLVASLFRKTEICCLDLKIDVTVLYLLPDNSITSYLLAFLLQSGLIMRPNHNNNDNNKQICKAPLGRNFRGACQNVGQTP